MVLTKGHDKSVDYWAIGVLVYELLCGCTPFESSSQPETFKKIVQSQRYLGFPPKFDPHAKSLIRKLLHPNAGLRLGALQSGFLDIKDHPFFVTTVRIKRSLLCCMCFSALGVMVGNCYLVCSPSIGRHSSGKSWQRRISHRAASSRRMQP